VNPQIKNGGGGNRTLLGGICKFLGNGLLQRETEV